MSMFNYEDFYTQIASNVEYSRFVEVGVYSGDSISFLARQLQERGTPFELYGVDLWEKSNDDAGYFLKIEPWVQVKAKEQVAPFPSVHLIQDDSVAAARRFVDQTLDFVFIDANHHYEQVLRDIAAWKPKIRPGGTISGHDFGEPCGVQQAVEEYFGVGQFSVLGAVWHRTLP